MKIDKSTLLIACLVIIAFLLGLNLQNKQSEVKPVPEPNPVKQDDPYEPDPVQEKIVQGYFESPVENPKRMVQCPICEGDGFDPRDLNVPCFGCKRLLKVDEETAKRLMSMKVNDWPYVEMKYYDCPMCFGTGIVGGRNVLDANPLTDRSCSYCHQGKVDAKEYYRLFKLKKELEKMGADIYYMPPL